ncbi:MAG: radical SAM protein [Polyangiaceae bacterium]|nr:radical SAM protein [Polyangiaceae bacterium]
MRAFPTDVELPKVEIHVTEVCNNRCGFCTTGWVNAEDKSLTHIPREIIRTQLQTAFDAGAKRALFQGGEPTVRRDLGDLLSDAHDIGYQATTIFTNARMAASKAGARWLAAMGVTWFQVSIQGGNAAAHDASVGAVGAFEQTVSGTRRLIALGQRVKINAVLTRHLIESLGEFAQLMISLAPEEVGLDTVKPSGAFGQGRASLPDLLIPLGPHRTQIRDAVLAMDGAGVVARLTSFPPCLAPGAEHLVSEEAPTTRTHQTSGTSVNKLLWKRGMQAKSPACAACAYNATCGGVYTTYADLYGTDELSPIAARSTQSPTPPQRAASDSSLTQALRAVFVRPETVSAKAPMRVLRVCRLVSGEHALDCVGPLGELRVELEPASTASREPPPYATTNRFVIRYANPSEADNPERRARVDLRLVDAVVNALRRVEPNLPREDE